jgi:hypothetical protein
MQVPQRDYKCGKEVDKKYYDWYGIFLLKNKTFLNYFFTIKKIILD